MRCRGDELSVDELSVDELSVDEMSVDGLSPHPFYDKLALGLKT